MNIEEAVISHLRTGGLDAYADVPAERPASFVTVERTGGEASVRIDRPTVAVQAWGPSRHEACELMLAADALMRELTGNASVCRVKRGSMYNFPDESQARYQAVYEIVSYI